MLIYVYFLGKPIWNESWLSMLESSWNAISADRYSIAFQNYITYLYFISFFFVLLLISLCFFIKKCQGAGLNSIWKELSSYLWIVFSDFNNIALGRQRTRIHDTAKYTLLDWGLKVSWVEHVFNIAMSSEPAKKSNNFSYEQEG